MPRFAAALVLSVLTFFTASASAGSGRTAFALAFEDGSFSALPPLCETGRAIDGERLVDHGLLRGLRRFDCGEGDGSVSAHTWLLAGDSSWGYEEGAWQIVAGTGAYERLRGKGTFIRAALEDGSGSAELWQGVVDFDDVPPQVTVQGISVDRPRRLGGAYTVRVSFMARDASGGPVSYVVAAKSSALLAASYGTARPGTTAVALRVRPHDAERSVSVEIDAVDQVGNVRTVARARSMRGAS
jgi:hypothetical protein